MQERRVWAVSRSIRGQQAQQGAQAPGVGAGAGDASSLLAAALDRISSSIHHQLNKLGSSSRCHIGFTASLISPPNTHPGACGLRVGSPTLVCQWQKGGATRGGAEEVPAPGPRRCLCSGLCPLTTHPHNRPSSVEGITPVLCS